MRSSLNPARRPWAPNSHDDARQIDAASGGGRKAILIRRRRAGRRRLEIGHADLARHVDRLRAAGGREQQHCFQRLVRQQWRQRPGQAAALARSRHRRTVLRAVGDSSRHTSGWHRVRAARLAPVSTGRSHDHTRADLVMPVRIFADQNPYRSGHSQFAPQAGHRACELARCFRECASRRAASHVPCQSNQSLYECAARAFSTRSGRNEKVLQIANRAKAPSMGVEYIVGEPGGPALWAECEEGPTGSPGDRIRCQRPLVASSETRPSSAAQYSRQRLSQCRASAAWA